MNDLISRQAAIDAVTKYCLKYDLRELLADIECLPTAEKKGEWIPVVDGNYIVWECSECHVESDVWTDYCPICGSRNIEEMDEEAFEEALEEFRKNPKTYTVDEVEAELGLTAKKGKWVKDEEQNHVELTWHCDQCGAEAWGCEELTPYCPMCGARMEESDDNE